MKKILAIVLSIVMIFSMSAIAFADTATPIAEAGAADETTAPVDIVATIKGILDQIMSTINTQDIAAQLITGVQNIVNEILAAIGVSSQTSVLGAVADLEAKIGDLGIIGDILEYIENLINTIKQKIKAFYAGNKETEIVATEAAAPADTGSTSAGIVAFAAVSVAAAAAYVCTKKKEN